MEFVDGKTKSTRCVPRDDLDDNYYCSLTQKSCESKNIFPNYFLLIFIIKIKPLRAARDSATPSASFVALFFRPTVPYQRSS